MKSQLAEAEKNPHSKSQIISKKKLAEINQPLF